MPDDYAAFLLPPVLARFAEDHPRVNVELVCEPSRLLVPAIDEGRIDPAIVTRLPAQSFEVLRREPFVWVAAVSHVAWSLDPLPVALFEPGCAARMNVIDALSVGFLRGVYRRRLPITPHQARPSYSASSCGLPLPQPGPR
ncbi:LysR substrate-binding domain-containing protein [Filomicrobium sp.]|uniref:LysR substrate-binding domain-containing protein n=1 Tax=Filomicrobium sp. TaxID=2024831 RepID=UPI00258E8E4B|nr:LysR substrate-binding domain-containing protein [Filomicrobium sp.]MCV0368153.1 hypothetical protein [Filomicrobium sp.]